MKYRVHYVKEAYGYVDFDVEDEEAAKEEFYLLDDDDLQYFEAIRHERLEELEDE